MNTNASGSSNQPSAGSNNNNQGYSSALAYATNPSTAQYVTTNPTN